MGACARLLGVGQAQQPSVVRDCHRARISGRSWASRPRGLRVGRMIGRSTSIRVGMPSRWPSVGRCWRAATRVAVAGDQGRSGPFASHDRGVCEVAGRLPAVLRAPRRCGRGRRPSRDRPVCSRSKGSAGPTRAERDCAGLRRWVGERRYSCGSRSCASSTTFWWKSTSATVIRLAAAIAPATGRAVVVGWCRGFRRCRGSRTRSSGGRCWSWPSASGCAIG